MRLLGFNITRTKAAPGTLSGVDNRGAWWPIIKESFAGAWQKNVEVRMPDVLAFPAAFRCISMISADVAKIGLYLVSKTADGVWIEAESPSFSPVLRKPNRFQTRIQFIRSWVESKLIHGNVFVLKERDNRNVVVALYVLDPSRVTVLVAPDGDVFYRLSRDDLSGQHEDDITVPASEIIHDRINTFYHPLVGLSPIYAAGLAAVQGMHIQQFSAKFFRNSARPGGILSAEGEISDPDAARLKEFFEQNYTGDNSGKIAVLGSGLSFKQTALTALDSQLIEQLGWSGEAVCTAFGVPAYKVGIGDAPTSDNVGALAQQYYNDCLHVHFEEIEALLDSGLELSKPYGTYFDVDEMFRMDPAAQMKMLAEGVKGGILKPDEGRKRINVGRTPGGDQVYLQQQNFSLAALAKRDAKADPFAKGSGAASAAGDPENPDEAPQQEERAARVSRFATTMKQKADTRDRRSA